MKWLLDTDVISQLAKNQSDPRVLAWFEAEEPRCYTSAIVIGQLAYWVRTKSGPQRILLQAWLRKFIHAFEGKIIGFNVAIAHVWAEQRISLEQAGQPMPVEDGLIAATARRHGFTVVTRNEKNFRRPGLKVFNPFKELAEP